MKKICIRSIVSFILAVICLTNITYAEALSSISAKSIGKTVEKAIPLEFGYVDNTEYYMNRHFSELKDADDSYIVTSAESTNFNEFGIFHFKNKSELKAAKQVLRDYLTTRRTEFESGVIYNTAEYPKFQNATVMTFENYVCYTILTPSDLKKATLAAKELFAR